VLLDYRKHRRPIAGTGRERSRLHAMHCVVTPCAVDRGSHDDANNISLIEISAIPEGSQQTTRLCADEVRSAMV
jgi:hypothetical protein